MQNQRTFAVLFTLRHLIDKLNENPDAATIDSIKEELKNLSDLQDILKYLLVPSIVHLNNNKLSKDIKLHVINFVQFIIERAKIHNFNTFMNIYTSLLVQIYSDPKFSEVISGHEELKSSILKCWIALIDKTSTDIIEQLYSRKYATKLAASVHACTLIAKFERSIPLRLTAIECMRHLLQIHDSVDKSDLVLRDQIADVIAIFLPGITSSMYEIFTASETQHHAITVSAVRTLGKYLSFLMKDGPEPERISDLMIFNKTEDSDCSSVGDKICDNEKLKEHLDQFQRNSEWYKKVADKLIIIFEKLKILTHHPHHKVRKELIWFVNEILFTCTRNLKPCFEHLFEVLVTLTEDESEEISEATNEIINLLCERSESGDVRSVLDICEENLYKLLTKLPRIMRTSDDSTQMISLKETNGYLKLLRQQRLSHILMSTAHSNRLIMSLVYSIELDCSNISLVNDITITEIDDPNDTVCKWKQFRFIFDPNVEIKIRTICHVLGKSDCLQLTIDSIFKFMACMPQFQKELILLMNWMLEATNCTSTSFYKQIIEQYLMPEVWYLPVSVSEEVSLMRAQSNVVQCCLLTEGLGIIANRLQSNYDQFLLKTLYIVIERAGHENSYLSFCGRQCLLKIAESQNQSASQLLQQNVDYISYYVTVKLRRIEINSNVLNVIKVVMEKSCIDFLPSLKSIIDNIFLNIRNKSKKKNIILYLKVFYIFATAVKRITNNDSLSSTDKTSDEVSIAQSIIKAVTDYADAKRDAANFEDVEGNDMIGEDEIKAGMDEYHENENENEEIQKPKVPYYVDLIESITKSCLNYLPSKEVEISLLSMAILNECLIILSTFENILLPMVHQSWHPLIDRFKSEKPIIINRAWDLLQTLSRISKDFIRSRTLKEVLPSINQFLLSSSKTSYRKESNTFYDHTQMYKLQKNLLSNLGKVSVHLSLGEEQLWSVLNIAQPYLSSFQHPKLQESCLILFEDIARYNSDVVWVKCLDIWHNNVEPVPDQNFETWFDKILEHEPQKEYVQNVKTILKSTLSSTAS